MIDFLKEEETRTQSYRGKVIGRCWEKATVYKPRRDASEETNPVDTLIVDFQPPEWWDSTFPLCEPCGLWCFLRQPWSFPGGSVVKNPPAMQDTQVRSLGQEDPLEEEWGNHTSILDNPTDRETWWGMVRVVTKSWTWLSMYTLYSLRN